MKRFTGLLVCLLIIIFGSQMAFARSETEGFIDVKIGKTYNKLDRVLLSADGGFIVYNKNDIDDIIMEIDSEKIYVSIGFADSRVIDIFGKDNNYITTLPADGSLILEPVSGLINLSGVLYRDYFGFVSGSAGLSVINHVDLENYLYGVVPREIPASGPLEALKAQSIAARSFAYKSMSKHAGDGFNLCDNTHCQVYGGYSCENPATNNAVDETYGLIATYNGQVADTVYHSSSGGYTESSEKVWGGRVPYLTAVYDPYSTTGPNSEWSISFSSDAIEEKLSDAGFGIGRLYDLTVLERTGSGRVVTIQITGSRGDVELSGDKFRSLIGTTVLKSTLFYLNGEAIPEVNAIFAVDSRTVSVIEPSRSGYSIISGGGRISSGNGLSIIGKNGIKNGTETKTTVKSNDGDYVFTGKGYGHGVGMSQYGAIEMAKQGFDFEEILMHYYRNIELTEIYR